MSEGGRFLGKVSDVLIDRADGRIFGYLLSEHTPGKKWEEIVGTDKKRRQTPYLPADAKIHAGRELIVVSEESVGYDWADEGLPAHETGAPAIKWGYAVSPNPIEAGPAETWTVTGDELHPMARTNPDDVDGVDTSRETNPRVR